MVNRSKAKGTSWESAIVAYLTELGWPHIERRTLAGSNDRGDIAGIPGIVIEAKSVKSITLGAFVDEAKREASNDTAVAKRKDNSLGVAWIKRRGHTSPAKGYVVMDGDTFACLLDEAGYGPNREAEGAA
jgi:hypothetical protein